MNTVCISNSYQSTLYDRMSKLLESFEWSDCSFRLGSETIKAHKLILAISSPVFKAMLYGPMFKGDEIIVSDIEPGVFQLLLDFIYKDKVYIQSLEDACGLLYAAKKYMLPCLVQICLKFIENSLSILNVLTLFNFSECIQEDDLSEKCLILICRHASTIFENDYDHISGVCLQKILKQCAINASEKDLIKFAFVWADNECLVRNLPINTENKRILLCKNECFQHLRFSTLSVDDLESLDILSIEELSVFKKYSERIVSDEGATDTNFDFENVLKNHLSLIDFPRNPMKLDWLYCYRPVMRSATPLIISNSFQNIKVKIQCKKNVFVKSVSILTRQSPVNLYVHESPVYIENLNLVVYCDSNEKQHISIEYKNELRYNFSTNIDFPKPFIFNENKWYTLSFTWPEVFMQFYKYPLCYRPSVCSDNMFVFDDDCSVSFGSFVEGLKFCL